MNTHGNSVLGWRFAVTLAFLFAWSCIAPPQALGQGLNAVYGSGNKVSSLAFVDASRYSSSGDICTAIFTILSTYHQGAVTGIVVDARGFPLPQGRQTYTCSQSPWPTYGSGSSPGSNVVLLPAGTIVLDPGARWVLLDNTRLVGEGPNLTLIQASSGFSGEMIDMGSGGTSGTCPLPTGSSIYDCQGVVIEHLALNGGLGSNVSGIYNQYSEELSRVNDVALTGMSGVGLLLGSVSNGNAADSGPYTDIYYYGSGICVQDNMGTRGGRGIHGLSCNMTGGASCGGSAPSAAICLDGQNYSLEDVSIAWVSGNQPQPMPDGILIGSQGSAQNNILKNISGTGIGNVVHISSQTNGASGNCPSNACDITAMGVTNSGSSATVQDDLTGATLTDSNIAMYVLGDSVPNAGYSRFTTSPNVPSWLIGTGNPSTPCVPATLYSCTGSCSNGTIQACAGGTSWKKLQ